MSDPETQWRKSTFSAASGCVSVNLRSDGGADVRDDKNPGGEIQSYSAHEWNAFIAGVKAGEFDPRDS